MENKPNHNRPKLSLVNNSKPKKKEIDEKEKDIVKENVRRNQAESHYIQTLRRALSEVIGTPLTALTNLISVY